jgi:hypothetical protein
LSPTKNTLPKVARIGWSASNVGRGQDTITASVPSRAPLIPPLTGASTHWMPRAARPSATLVAVLGPVVERSTMVLTRAPSAIPASPSATRWRMSGVGRLVITISAAAATSAAELAGAAPRSTMDRTAGSLMSKTVTACPASSRRPTIGPPIRPSPTNPRSQPGFAIRQCLTVPLSDRAALTARLLALAAPGQVRLPKRPRGNRYRCVSPARVRRGARSPCAAPGSSPSSR